MFDVLSRDEVPEGSRSVLEEVENKYGMIPNLFGVLAQNPSAVKAYAQLNELFADSGLGAAEQQVVLLATSVENGCTYCVGAHSAVSAQQELFDEKTLEALRAGEPLEDDRLEALRSFTRKVVEERGWLDDHEVQSFLDAGFSRKDVLAVLTGVAMKTLSNYTNHIAETPLDEPFRGFAWKSSEPAAV